MAIKFTSSWNFMRTTVKVLTNMFDTLADITGQQQTAESCLAQKADP